MDSADTDARLAVAKGLWSALANRGQNIGNDFAARLGAEIAFAVNAYADGVRFQVAIADHQHSVDFHLLGAEFLVNR
jgi:hypothetical protein